MNTESIRRLLFTCSICGRAPTKRQSMWVTKAYGALCAICYRKYEQLTLRESISYQGVVEYFRGE